MIVTLTIESTQIKVHNDGTIERKMKTEWKEIVNKQNHNKGYNVIMIEKKQYMRSKIVAHAFWNIDLYDKYIFICHKDNDKLNTSLKNLQIKKK